MVHTNRIVIIYVLGLVLTSGCTSARFALNDLEQKWKIDWVNKFLYEYTLYDQEFKTACTGAKRDVVFDIRRKIGAVTNYPISNVLTSIQEDNINFDSLIMENIHDPIFEAEYTYASTFFYIFHRGNIRGMIVHVDDDQNARIEMMNNAEDEYKLLDTKLAGCQHGFITKTLFSKDWSFEIKKIIINPDNIIQVRN